METKRVTHPADLLDREGFLRFLNDQARQGWEAQEIGVYSTLFRKTDIPPRGYTMAYHRDKEWPHMSEEGYHIVPCSVNGFAVYPTDEIVLADPTWPEQVVDDFGGVPSLAFADRIRALPLVLPVMVLLDLLGLEWNRWGTGGSAPIQGPMFWVLLILCVAALAGAVGMAWTNRCHSKGLRAARDGRRVYRPSEGLSRLVAVKNRLVRVQAVLSVLTFLLFLVFSAIASGSIQY